MFKAVLFDFDSTLVDYRYGDYLAIEKVRQRAGLNIEPNIFYEASKKILYKLYENPNSACIDVNEVRIKKLLNDYNVNWNKQYLDDYYKIYLSTVLIYDGVNHLLGSLKNIVKIGLLTNSIDSNNQRQRIKASKIDHYFSEIGIANEIGYWKPDPESFSWLARKLNVRNEECIFVGDNEKIDIEGARKANMFTIKRNRKDKDNEKTIAERSFSEFWELHSLLNELL
jgi:putative hydrolase of the HAD superfamily